MTEAQLRRAAGLFNAGEYHEAHEVLDELWESTHGEAADFYKGLIQACIAMHHYSRANLDGARKLYRGHRQYLAPYLPSYLELDVSGFLASMQETLQPLVRARPGSEPVFEPGRRPRLDFVERP